MNTPLTNVQTMIIEATKQLDAVHAAAVAQCDEDSVVMNEFTFARARLVEALDLISTVIIGPAQLDPTLRPLQRAVNDTLSSIVKSVRDQAIITDEMDQVQIDNLLAFQEESDEALMQARYAARAMLIHMQGAMLLLNAWKATQVLKA
jgi:hypothetical protein